MTEIDFHFHVPDTLTHACRLLRKVVTVHGCAVVVVADAPALDAVDQALWTFSPTDFIAHCRTDAAAALCARSAVLLADSAAGSLPHHEVLLNLARRTPTGFERFERLIDLVGEDEEDRAAARERWRHYAQRGYAIRRHDFAGARAA